MNKRFSADAKAFSSALKKVSRISQKNRIPILSEVLVQVEAGQCTLTGTDMSTWLSASIPAQGDDLAFVFSRTREVERACRHFDGEITVELSESGEGKLRRLDLSMCCGVRAGAFAALPAEDYPIKPPAEPETELSVDTERLLERIERVRYAAEAPGSGTPTARSFVQFSETHIFAVDGRRLSCDTDQAMRFPRPFLAPAGPLAYLRLLEGKQAVIRLGRRYIQITDGDMSLQFRTPEDFKTFDLEKSVPKDFAEVFCVSPGEFRKELAYLKEFCPGDAKPYVRFCGGELLLSSYAGQFRTRVEVDGRSEIAFGFDLRNVMDALEQFKGEDFVYLKIAGRLAPFVIEAESRGDFAMVCPVQLKEKLAA